MKAYTLITMFVLAANLTVNCQNTRTVHITKLEDLDTLNLNFCDTFSLEITGLYPILDTLPSAMNDHSLVKTLLLEKGFKKLDSGLGNWQKGPRMIYLEYGRDKCDCRVFKKYYFNKKIKDSYYNLRISERIICNSKKLMDD